MATKTEILGTGQEVDLTSPTSIGSGFVKAAAGGMLAIGALSIGKMAWNRVASTTPDELGKKVNLL